MSSEYVEVVLEGSMDIIKGFVAGFLEGRGIKGEAVFEEEHGTGEAGGLAQLLRFIGLKDDRIHLIVDREIHELLKDAVRKREQHVPVKIVSVRTVREAHFTFRYRTYSRHLGGELKDLFRKLPEGVMLQGHEPREVSRPKAKGIEAYAPEHDYEMEGEGMVQGRVREVIDFHDRLRRYEFMELGDILMEYKDADV